MNKIKRSGKKGVVLFTVKGQKGQQLCQHELQAVNQGKMPGLLTLQLEDRGSSFDLVYNVTGLLPLQELMATPLRKKNFIRILESILQTLQGLQSNYFNMENLLLDSQYVVANPYDQSLHFLYIPIQGHSCGTPLREFLRELVRTACFAQDEDTAYITRYIQILNAGTNLSVFELEEYVRSLEAKPVAQPVCQPEPRKTSGHLVYDPLAYADTPVEDHRSLAPVLPVQLIRHRTGQFILVTKTPFRIGRTQACCDHAISDSRTISGNHADILIENGRCYIVDLYSRNKTFVAGRPIPPDTKVQLQHGQKLQLADELFTVCIG